MKRFVAVIAIACTFGMLVLAIDASLATETIKYVYDARGRLVRVERTGSVNNNVKTNYSLDKAGNRTNVTTTGK
jgi:YD repeat-containing protein